MTAAVVADGRALVLGNDLELEALRIGVLAGGGLQGRDPACGRRSRRSANRCWPENLGEALRDARSCSTENGQRHTGSDLNLVAVQGGDVDAIVVDLVADDVDVDVPDLADQTDVDETSLPQCLLTSGDGVELRAVQFVHHDRTSLV